ncbi:LamG-like jellyroll fold domain-containing protein [candidate division KSB1 bacterium]
MRSAPPLIVRSRPRRSNPFPKSTGGLLLTIIALSLLFNNPAALAVEINKVGFWSGASCQDVYVNGNIAYVAVDSGGVTGLRIVDISDPADPAEIGSCATPGTAFGVFFQDGYAYVADGAAGLRIIDVSDTTNPAETGSIDTPGEAVQVFVSGNYAYVADGPGGLRIVDVSNPVNPVEVGYSETDYAHDVFVAGSRAYVAADNVLGTLGSGDGLRIYDISNPSSPTAVNFVSTPGNAYGVYVTERHAYVADDTQGLRIIAGIDSLGQMEIGNYLTPGYANKVYAEGDYAYMTASTYGLYLIDVSQAGHPFQADYFPITGHVRGITGADGYIYMCNNTYDNGGLYILQLVSKPMVGDLVGYWPFNKGNGAIAYDSTSNENHGSIEGATWFSPGVRDACLDFNNGHVQIPDTVMTYSASQDFTWALWCKPSGFNLEDEMLMSRRRYNSESDWVATHLIYQADGRIRIHMGADNIAGADTIAAVDHCSWTQINDGDWHHVAVSRDIEKGVFTLYINGGRNTSVADNGADMSAESSFRVGQEGQTYGGSRQFHGLIDEVMIFDYALSNSEIEELASWEAPTPEEESITVASPNGGEVWGVGTTHNITWTSSGDVGLVRVEYSTNSGVHWMGVADSTANDSNYSWTVPPYPSSDCLIRITDISGAPSDVSDNEFTVSDTTGLQFSILDIADIPNDQGKQVRIRWGAHDFDTGSPAESLPIIGYSLWRMVDSARESTLTRPQETPDGLWEQVGLTPAVQDGIYSLVVPTIADSTIVRGMYYSIFFVRAHTAYPTGHYSTAPDSGWSVDNLVPAAPTSGGGFRLATGENVLSWSEAVDDDFNYFVISRGQDTGFDAAAVEAIGTTATSSYADMPPDPEAHCFYRVAAVDFSGNMSLFSEEISIGPNDLKSASGISDNTALPDKFDLAQNFPNPFNPETTIRFATPEDSFVSLSVYNIFGQLVRTLKNERLPAGFHQIRWDGRDDMGRFIGSGVYFYSIKAGDYTGTRRMVLLK